MTDSTRLVTNSQRIAPTRTESVLKVRFVQYGRHRRLTTKKPKTLDGRPLYTLTEKLRTILLCLILELLGLSHLEINEVVAAQE